MATSAMTSYYLHASKRLQLCTCAVRAVDGLLDNAAKLKAIAADKDFRR